jgi:hypothetical protein
MSKHAVLPAPGRKRFSAVVIGAGLVAAVALSLSFSGTLSAFTLSFVHSTNTVSTASTTIEQRSADGSTVNCAPDANGAASCSNTNLYSGMTLRPGDSQSTTVTFKNTGTTTPTHFTFNPGACTTTPSSGTDLCDRVVLTMKWRGADVLSASTTPKSIAGTSKEIPNPPAPGESSTAVVTVALPTGSANDTSGLSLSQPITWTFTA